MSLLLITVNGTGIPAPFDNGPTSFPGWVGWAIGDPFIPMLVQCWGPQWQQQVQWQPIGYPAAVGNMGKSVTAGRLEVVSQIQARPLGTPIVLCGYSQGAMVTGQVWAQDILSPAGVLHNRLNDVKAIFNFGDPYRCPGVAHGNELVGLPLPPKVDGQVTGGISGPLDLTLEQTPEFLYSIVLPGDLYADAPVGANPWSAESAAGYVGTSIFNIVQHVSIGTLFKIAADLLHPIGMVEEIINGLTFFGAGPNAAHYQYGPHVGAVIGKLEQIVGSL